MATGETGDSDKPSEPESEGFRGSPVVGDVRSARLGDPQLDEWEAQIRQYAAEMGYNLTAVLRDEGVSAVVVWKPKLSGRS